MKIRVDNRCSDFGSYRTACVKSLFNAESGANFTLDAELPMEDCEWSIGVVNDTFHTTIKGGLLPGFE